ncbi:MAG: anhydro-N-acetylmuramic acid kinase, partial [Paraperlucidibaca sp.]
MTALYIGLMSGTSLDALDAVLVDLGNTCAPRLIGEKSHAWQTSEREELLALAAGCDDEIDRSGRAGHWWAQRASELIAELLKDHTLQPSDIRAIGSHGQTLRHRPLGTWPYTLQIGDPSLLAELSGISVVAHFRQRDIAAGGQGAPLVPAFHQAVFARDDRCVVALNLGGIANISVMQPGHGVRGYDTGPANMLLDGWCQRHSGKAYDENGRWAASGQCHDALLDKLLAMPYFSLPAPKSTGRESFGMRWLEQQLATLGEAIPAEDVQATLLALTATTVADAILREASAGELILCGGGANNTALCAALATKLPNWHCLRSEAYGYPTQAIEAMAFAWLAMRFVQGLSGNVPE